MKSLSVEGSNRILAHRGIWDIYRQNSYEALNEAFERGFGVETDIRLFSDQVVLSHDPVNLDLAPPLESILVKENLVALNVKMDGLLSFLDLQVLELSNYFFFDGSIPEIFRYKQAGLRVACRLSEFEAELPWASPVIWLDSFLSDWWTEGDILPRLSEDAFVVIVSPELHGRDYRHAWEVLANELTQDNPNLAICTDLPARFEEFVK
jgi:hypothetical protein